jgi:CubicO group peptidase (beta-lactamase class C family)
MKNLNRLIDTLFENRSLENVAIRVGIGNDVVADIFRSNSAEIDEFTLFDIASVSKIVCTTSLTLLAFDKGLLTPDTKIEKFYQIFNLFSFFFPTRSK